MTPSPSARAPGRGTRRLGAVVLLLLAAASCSRQAPVPQGAASYVGRAACARCHTQENDLWRGSDHDLAMQAAAPATVLGDFDDATFTWNGVTSTFFRDDGRFMVRTETADGTLQNFEVAYTFGVDPLQQYLIGFPDGRYQALGIAWDTRRADQGGQRWFHLYPDQVIAPGDELHWTAPSQNWNHMCADCHSTRLRKNYDADTHRFATTWAEINVACEACHGPGSHHVAWAEWREAQYESAPVDADDDMGLVHHLRDRDGGRWVLGDTMVTAVRVPPRASNQRIETCAPCHSRRLTVQPPEVGDPFLDNHRPALLTEGLYHPDGQIRDEVYVYGSFLQSRMFHAGVTCSDCHDPHSLSTGFAPDMACNQCHLPSHYAARAHHFHEEGTRGASCVECHMPETTYMVVDPRRDHSIRIPRPDLSLTLGVPNACNQCHTDSTTQWAADTMTRWYGEDVARTPHWGEALAAGWSDSLQAEDLLQRVVDDPDQPDMVRASALLELGDHLSPRSLPALRAGLRDTSALVRFAAVQATSAVPPPQRVPLLMPLLEDPVRLVRAEAAEKLAPVDLTGLPVAIVARFDSALAEYLAMQRFHADRAESHLNLGVLALQLGDPEAAERAYRKALELRPDFTEAAVNLADLYRHRGQEQACGATLERALERDPDHAAAQHALGLQRIRTGRAEDALEHLRRATQEAARNARYAYVYGVTLHSTGRKQQGLEMLEATHRRHPGNTDVLAALVGFLQEDGRDAQAQAYADKLQRLSAPQHSSGSTSP